VGGVDIEGVDVEGLVDREEGADFISEIGLY
jgi:hypothetical protein